MEVSWLIIFSLALTDPHQIFAPFSSPLFLLFIHTNLLVSIWATFEKIVFWKAPSRYLVRFSKKCGAKMQRSRKENSKTLQFQIDSGQEKGLICGWSKVQRIWRVRTWCKTMKEFDSSCACKHAYLSNLEVTCLKWIYFSKFWLLKQTKSVLVVPNRCLILWLKMKEIYFWREISLVGSYADCLLS